MPLLHNLVQLTGRTSQPTEPYFLTDGTAFVRFRLYQDEVDQTGKYVSHSFPVAAWGRLAETLSHKVKRGDRLMIQGKLRMVGGASSEGSTVQPEIQLSSFHLLRRPASDSADGKNRRYQNVHRR